MKKISLIVSAMLAFFGLTALSLIAPARTTAEPPVSFYQTNLVCGAAPDIGCGTRAKPILVDFMKHEAVREAWLNHAGTIIAVVWKPDKSAEKSAIANKIFAGHQQPFLELTGREYEAQLVDFDNGKWYKGTEVDQLSMIEAGRIAGQIMNSLDGKLNVPPQMKETLRGAFEEYIKEEFLKIEDADAIYELGYWKRWERDLTAIGKEFLGEEMPEIQIVSSSGECKLDNSNSKSSCCKKGS